jgi:bacteriorhodopsin
LSALARKKYQLGYIAISVILYLYVIYVLFIPARRAAFARNERLGRFFTAISVYTIIVWTAYPVVAQLGDGVDRITVDNEIILHGVVSRVHFLTNESLISSQREFSDGGC